MTRSPGTIVLLGGTSGIGLSIVEALLARAPAPVVVAARAGSPRLAAALSRLREAGASSLRTIDFDALDLDGHAAVIEAACSSPVSVAVVAFGVLGEAEAAWQRHEEAIRIAQTDYTAAVSVGVLLGRQLRAQGGGTIIALSSMAGEQVRRANFVYGSAKAGMDAFYTMLGEALRPWGVRVLVVRPGFVTTAMTSGRRPVPFAVPPEEVASAVLRALRRGQRVVRVPALFGPVMAVYRNLPLGLRTRLPF